MYVLFRLERVEGIVPIVDEHVSESVIVVDMRYAHQIQSTDEYAVPTRSARVQLDTRTQLLWIAPAGSAPGTLELQVYQDWPRARQAHPFRACLGGCTLNLPAIAGSSHAAVDVRAPLETTSHPLATVADWPSPVAHGVVEISSLRPTAAATAPSRHPTGRAALLAPAAAATAAPSHSLPRVAGLIRRQPYSTQSKPPRPASAAAAAQPAPRPPAAASPRPTSAPPLPAPRAARPGRGSYVSAFPPASASESDLLAAAHAAARVDWERSDFAQAAQRLARDADADDPPELAAARAAAGSTPASLGASAALALSSGRGSPRPMAARPFAFDSEAHIHLEPTLHDARARQTPCQPAPTRTRPQPGPAAARAQPPLPAQGSRARVESAGSGGGVAFAFGSGSSVDAVAAGLARVTPPHPSPADSTRVLRELAQLQDDVAIARVGLWSKSPAPYPPAAAGSSAASRRAEPWRPTTNVRRAATDRPLAESGSELPDYARLAQANRARFRPRSARAAAPKAARRGAEARPDDSLGSGEMAVKLAQLERRIAEALTSCDEELKLKPAPPATGSAAAGKPKSPTAAVPRNLAGRPRGHR